MLARIMRHEWRLLKTDRTALVVGGLFMLAAGYAVFEGAERVRQERAALDRYIAAHEALVERYRERAAAIERIQAGGSSG